MSSRAWRKTARHEAARLRARHRRGHCDHAPTQLARAAQIRELDDEHGCGSIAPTSATAVPRRVLFRRERCRPESGKKPRATRRRGSVPRKRHQRGHRDHVPTRPVRAARIGKSTTNCACGTTAPPSAQPYRGAGRPKGARSPRAWRKDRAPRRGGSVTRKRHQRGHWNSVPAQPVRAAQIGEVDDELRLRHHRPRLP